MTYPHERHYLGPQWDFKYLCVGGSMNGIRHPYAGGRQFKAAKYNSDRNLVSVVSPSPALTEPSVETYELREFRVRSHDLSFDCTVWVLNTLEDSVAQQLTLSVVLADAIMRQR